jgi:spore coat polysaccharide biosynthesis predicted glycosyltransferase SpsG
MAGGSHVLFRVDVGVEAGLGHVRRVRALAAALRRGGATGSFVLGAAGPGRDWLVARGESPIVLDAAGEDEAAAIVRQAAGGSEASGNGPVGPGARAGRSAARRRAPAATGGGTAAVVVDVAEPVGRRYVTTLRRAGLAVVLIDDAGPGRLHADLVVSPAAPAGTSWLGTEGRHFASPAYAILAETFGPRAARTGGPLRLLVSMGGSDPDGMTFTALEALELIDGPLRPVLVVGPVFPHHARLQEVLARARRPYEVHYGVAEMAPLVASADVALAAFGTVAYELAAAGVPAVLVPRRDADRWHAEQFAAAGAAVVAGRRAQGLRGRRRAAGRRPRGRARGGAGAGAPGATAGTRPAPAGGRRRRRARGAGGPLSGVLRMGAGR